MRGLRSARGAELIEMALILPLLLVIVAGIIDFGFLFQRFVVLTNAAREGARVAVLPGYLPVDGEGNPITTAIEGRVRDYVRDGLGEPTANPGVFVTRDALTAGFPAPVQLVRVRATLDYDYLILGPVAALLGGNFDSITLEARATMRLEAGG
jgi:hypothetical protein